ncbi:MAG TPA: AraC family transcriptional regulator [Hymenobacter sp.]|jgi:AraC-like DNA-binding protein
MKIRLPQYFQQDPAYRTIEVAATTVASYRRAVDSRDTPVHLSENLLLLVLSGQKIVRMAGQPDLLIGAGEGAFIRKGLYLMSSVSAGEQFYESVLFFLKEEPVRQFVQQYQRHFTVPATAEPAATLTFGLTPALQGFVQSVLPYFESCSSAQAPLLQLKFQELLLHFVLGPEAACYHQFLLHLHHTGRYDLRLLMEQNFQRPFSLTELAFLSGRSLATFKRDFQAVFRQPPAQWLKARRLEHAHFLLRTTALNVSQVADEVGFTGTSHFVQAFRERFGYTPGRVMA